MKKFYEEVEDTADTLGDMLTTLEDIEGINDYITREELDKCWDAYDILFEAAHLISVDEDKGEF